MGLFRRKQDNATEQSIYKMVVDCGNGFYAWNGKLYKSDVIRACIKPKTKAIGKAVAKHIRRTVDKEGNKKISVNPSVNTRFLLEEPNEFMTGQMLQEKVANQLALNGNAFILIIRDSFGVPVGLYPIPATNVEAKYDENHELYLKFYYMNGKQSEFYYHEVIHIRDDFFFNDIFGENPVDGLSEVMDLVGTINQGMSQAIKNSNVIRWLLKFTASMRDEDLKIKAKDFADNYLQISNNSTTVAAIDAKADAIQVKQDNYVPEADQITKQEDRIYSFFNTNKKIVQSQYSEDEWISYYEAAIEPVLQQMAGEYTRKLFTRRERGCGNEIIFDSSKLTFASMKTKLQLGAMADRGIMTPNEVREVFNLPPVDGGDVPLLRKDTGHLTEIKEDEDDK